MLFLEDRELAVLTVAGVELSRLDDTPVERRPSTIQWDPIAAAKGDYKHFMQKEIYEQPRALTHALRGRGDLEAGTVLVVERRLSGGELRRLARGDPGAWGGGGQIRDGEGGEGGGGCGVWLGVPLPQAAAWRRHADAGDHPER